MMRILRTAGLVQSTRGQAGGYSLARPAGEINVGEALAALGGRLYEPSFCDTHAGIIVAEVHLAAASRRHDPRQPAHRVEGLGAPGRLLHLAAWRVGEALGTGGGETGGRGPTLAIVIIANVRLVSQVAGIVIAVAHALAAIRVRLGETIQVVVDVGHVARHP